MKRKILIADDVALNRSVLREIFEGKFDIIEATSGEKALEALQLYKGQIALVLLDLMMGKMSGFDVLNKRNETPELRDIPVVVITGSSETEDQARAFELGASEYLLKPFDPVIVSTRVQNVLTLHQKMLEAKSQAESLKEISERDEMTGIYNKATAERQMDRLLRQSEGSLEVLLAIDIDKFKSINDTYGHQNGDLVIKATADMLVQNFRKTDIVGRIGGDEFCILMVGLPNLELARKKVDTLLQSVKVSLNNLFSAFATISVGMASNEYANTTYAELFAKADAALYDAKNHGRAQCREYGYTAPDAAEEQAGYQSPEAVLQALLHFYMDDKNVDATMGCVTDDIQWVGTEVTDRAVGKAALRGVLEASVAAFPYSFGAHIEDLDRQVLSGELVQLLFDVSDRADGEEADEHVQIRMSACCEKTAQGWKVKSFHSSMPSNVLNTYALQKELDRNRKMEQTLLAGLMGGAGIYRLKKDGRLEAEYVTDGVARLFGYDDNKEFMACYQHDARVFTPPEDLPVLEKAIADSLKTGEPAYAICYSHVKDGPDVLQRIDANLIDTPLGEDDVAVWYAVHTKVTDAVAQELKEQARYRLILEMLHVAYWEWSKKDGYYISPKYYDYAISEADQNTLWTVDEYKKYVHPEDLQRMIDFINKEKDPHNTAKEILRCKLKDGSFQWTEMYSFNEYDKNGEVCLIISAMRAVDEAWLDQKRQLEDALKAARAAHRQGE